MKSLLTILLLTSLSLRAAIINVPANYAAIATAVTVTAQEGDTVQIAAGTFTWTAPILVDRNISFTITGSGTNSTFIASSGTGGYGIWFKSSSTNVYVPLANATIYGAAGDTSGFVITGGNPGSSPMRGPYHIYNLNMPSIKARGVALGSGDSFGLTEYCHFATTNNVNFTHVTVYGNDYASWATANPLGTTNAVYVENCAFETVAGAPGNGFFDCYDGAQVVLRHNTYNGSASSGSHGYDSQPTSVRTGEIYANTWTGVGASPNLIDWRGGTFLWFSNTVSAPSIALSSVVPLLKLYRACDGIVPTIDNYANIPQVVTIASNPSVGTQYQLINQPKYTIASSVTGGGNVNRNVLRGSTTADTISNLVSAINLDPAGSGTRYAALTTRNVDVKVVSYNSTSLTLSNVLDGSASFSWPAAQQQGVISALPYTNTITRYPCYSWANTVNNTNVGFGLAFATDACNGHNNVTNLLHVGRDYFMDTDVTWAGPPGGYTPLVFPHPLSISTNTPPPAAGTNSPVIFNGRIVITGRIEVYPK